MKNLNNLKDLGDNISRPNDKDTYDRYIREINKLKPLSREEEVELFKKIEESKDRRAIEKICRHNLLFVVSVAKRYSKLIGNSRLTLEDLISEGNLGLYRAIERFDYKSGNKFISYAVWWIRQSILASIQENIKSIRLPNNVRSMVNKIKKKELELEQLLERNPSTTEIFEAMLTDGEMTDKDSDLKIDELLKMSKFESSLNTFMSDDSNCEIGDMVKCDNPQPDDDMVAKERINLANEMLNKLAPREKRVLCLYFGLQGHDQLSVSEIAELEDVTTSSVRNWIEKSLRRLKSNNRKSKNFFFQTPDYSFNREWKSKWGGYDKNTTYLL